MITNDEQNSHFAPEQHDPSHELANRIKDISPIARRFLDEFYTNALKANPDSAKKILRILDLDIQAIQEQGEELQLNQSREEAFTAVNETLRELIEKDESGRTLEKWLAEAFNNIFHLSGEHNLQASDFHSVRIGFTLSARVAVLTGRETERPVIIFDNQLQFAKVYSHILPGNKSPHGAYIPLGSSKADYSDISPEFLDLANAGIVLSDGEHPATLSHELTHTVDPYLTSRKGFDRILTEALAFFPEVNMDNQQLIKFLDQPGYQQKNLQDEDESDEKLVQAGYSENSRFGETVKTSELHRKVVETVVNVLFSDVEKMGVIQALRRLARSSSIEQYLPYKLKREYSR